jgi:hypothetical protein
MKTYGINPLVLILAVAGALVGGMDSAYAGWPPIISDPVPVNANAAVDSDQDMGPQLVTDGHGTWLSVWYSNDDLGGTIGCDYDVLLAISTDGISWSWPAPLNSDAAYDNYDVDDLRPQIDTDGAGTWVALWDRWDSPNSYVLYRRSTDNGRTWSPQELLSTGGADDYPRIATDGQGTWLAVWSAWYPDADIVCSRSTDAGLTWTAPEAVNGNAATDSGDDTDPVLSTDGHGTWIVAWRSNDDLSGTIGVEGDILFSRSTDQGVSWSWPEPLNSDADTDHELDMDSEPDLVNNTRGDWIAVWTRYTDIAVAHSTDHGASWSDPLLLNDPAKDGCMPDAAFDDVGNSVVVWTSKRYFSGRGWLQALVASHSIDQGAAWSEPHVLRVPSGGCDWNAQLVVERESDWLLLWQGDDMIGSPLGGDWDVLLSTFQLDPVGCTGAAGSGDVDSNGVVDQDDFVAFADCLTGPGVRSSAECGFADMDGDCEIDLADYAQFQCVFVDANLPTHLTPVDDATIDRTRPDQVLGHGAQLQVRNDFGSTTGYEIDTLIQFDLDDIPVVTPIESATLYIYYYAWEDRNPGGRIHRCRRLDAEWDESTATWNNRPGSSSVTSAEATVPDLPGNWMSWSVTADVQAFIDGALDNHGWVLRDEQAWGGAGIPYTRSSSKEYGSNAPYLEIVYEP